MPLTLQKEDGTECYFQDLSEIFVQFFKTHESLVKDDNKQQSFRCEYNEDNILENDDFRMFYTRIYSGVYGSSSDIIDGNTQKVKYKKKSSDIDTRPYYCFRFARGQSAYGAASENRCKRQSDCKAYQ